MTQEDKKLLLKDLCARLPYGVKGIRTYKPEETITLTEIIPRCKMNPNIGNGSFCELGFDETLDCCVITEFKPYLRPMSSMTEEEKNIYEYNRNSNVEVVRTALFDWLNKNHFDYRGLIPIGLALEAPEGMYNVK